MQHKPVNVYHKHKYDKSIKDKLYTILDSGQFIDRVMRGAERIGTDHLLNLNNSCKNPIGRFINYATRNGEENLPLYLHLTRCSFTMKTPTAIFLYVIGGLVCHTNVTYYEVCCAVWFKSCLEMNRVQTQPWWLGGRALVWYYIY